jgi:hypothetical protein
MDALETDLIELLDAVLFDVLFAGEAELLLDFDFDRQAMGVPAGLAHHVPTPHRLEPRKQILDDARYDMTHVGLVVGSGRALEEDERFTVLGLFQALGEDVAAPPLLEHLQLELRERVTRLDVGESLNLHYPPPREQNVASGR